MPVYTSRRNQRLPNLGISVFYGEVACIANSRENRNQTQDTGYMEDCRVQLAPFVFSFCTLQCVFT